MKLVQIPERLKLFKYIKINKNIKKEKVLKEFYLKILTKVIQFNLKINFNLNN